MANGDFAEIPSIKKGLEKASKTESVESLPEATKEDLGKSKLVTTSNVSKLYFCLQTGVDTYEWKEIALAE